MDDQKKSFFSYENWLVLSRLLLGSLINDSDDLDPICRKRVNL